MDDVTDPGTIEADLRAAADAMTSPDENECVFCYVLRMLDDFGCDTTLRWARRWRDLRMPRATGLERRLGARGAFCDCEIFLNGWNLVEELQVRDENGHRQWPRDRLACAAARFSQPCTNWEKPRWPRHWWEWG